jgi:hypothetical protein
VTSRGGRSAHPEAQPAIATHGAEHAQERFARKNEAAELRRAFDLLDSKADGRLDAEELGRVLARLSHRARKARGPPAAALTPSLWSCRRVAPATGLCR